MKKNLLTLLFIPFLSACLSTPVENNPSGNNGDNGITNPSNPNENNNGGGQDNGNNTDNTDNDDNSGTTNNNNSGSDNNDGDNNTNTDNNDNSDSSNSGDNTSSNIKTIKEVREMCEQYVTNLNSSNIGIDMDHKVTIRAFAAQKFDLVKTKASFGLDVSAPAKVLFVDETGYICSASNGGSSGTTLFGKVGDYAGKDGSYYEVTGYLSIYLGKPEIFVPDKEYTWNENLQVNYDYDKLYKEVVSLDQFYTAAKANNYNCAGHGYGDIYKINKVKCLAKNDSVYIFTDGEHYLKVIKEQVTFTVGSTYDIIGTLSLQNYSPALRALKAVQSSEAIDPYLLDHVTTTTITNFKKTEASKEDTNKRFDNYIDSFKYLYKSTVFASYFTVNGKYNVTISDSYYKGTKELSSEDSACNTYGMIELDNNNCWNASWNEIEKYCSISEYINVEQSFDVYFVPWQSHYTNKKVVWKVYMIEGLL